MEYYYVKLVRMKLGILKAEPVDKEDRLFSSMEAVETWLADNGFIYGQRSFFNYPEGGKEWIHKDDISMEYIDVSIRKMVINDSGESKFKNLGEKHMEWLPKFLEELAEDQNYCLL